MAATLEKLEALYRQRYLGFRRAFAMMTGSFETAHEVVQEAFAQAVTDRHRFSGEQPLGAWVWEIALRQANAMQPAAVLVALPDIPTDVSLDSTQDRQLLAALRALPPRRRLIFFLRHLTDLSYEDIASVCGISEGTVAATVAQARQAVVSELAGSSVAA